MELLKEKEGFFSKHSDYFSTIWGISIVVAGISAIIDWLKIIFEAIQAGSFWGFVIAIVFHSIIVLWYTLSGAVILFFIVVVVTIIPYLIYRGATK